jgi:hypothetical protein
MNREQTKAAAEIMLQWANDPTAQVEYKIKTMNFWIETQNPVWEWTRCDYRIKPKPAEFWALITENCGSVVVTAKNKSDALKYMELYKETKLRLVKLTETPEC